MAHLFWFMYFHVGHLLQGSSDLVCQLCWSSHRSTGGVDWPKQEQAFRPPVNMTRSSYVVSILHLVTICLPSSATTCTSYT